MRAHRNLHSLTRSNVKAWSFYADGCKRVQGAERLTLYGVTPHHPTPTNKKFQKCLAGGARSVFAWFNAEDYRTDTLGAPSKYGRAVDSMTDAHIRTVAKRIRFNPTTGAEYFHVDGIKWEGSAIVWLLSDGSAWEIERTPSGCWAVGI